MDSDSQTITLSSVPTEILKHIASFMADKTRRLMRLASTRWFQLINYRNFTVFLTTTETLPQIVDRLLQYNSPVGLTFKKGKIRTVDDHMQHVSRLTNLISLNFVDVEFKYSLEPVTWAKLLVLTNLTELNIPTGQYSPSILTALVNLSSLAIQQQEMVEALLASGPLKMTNLERLTVAAECSQLDVCSQLPCPSRLTFLQTSAQLNHSHVTKLHNLRKLALEGTLSMPFCIELEKLTALDDLSLGAKLVSTTTFPTTLTRLVLSCQQLDPRSMEAMARLHGLKDLSILKVEGADEQFTWLSALSRLEVFRWWPNGSTNMNLVNGEIFGHLNANKLTRITVNVNRTVTLGHMTQLTGLKQLYINEIHYAMGCDYSFVSALKRLTSIELRCDALHSLTALVDLTHLKCLSVRRANAINLIQFPAISLAHMTGLEQLALKQCAAVTLQSLFALTHLTSLRVASLDPSMDYEFLTDLPLQHLECETDNAGEDNFNHVLTKLTGLHDLAVRGLNSQQVANLSSLQHLTMLQLMNCRTGVDGENIPALSALQTLQVHYSDLKKDLGEIIARKFPSLIKFVSK